MKAEDLEFQNIVQNQLKPYSKRAPTDSLKFLRWVLEHIFRQDPQGADDACVDGQQDKGVDGILVNQNLEEIYIFQSKLRQKDNAKLGDKDLKEFTGTLHQFSSPDNVQKILDGNANKELKLSISRNDIIKKLEEGYSIHGIFCTNVPMNVDGIEYSKKIDNFSVYDANRICSEYVEIDAPTGIKDKFIFDTSDSDVISYQTSEGVQARIFLANALQMTLLHGIADGSLFSLNVRLSLGNTKVNKALLGSIRDKNEHKNFPLYHNGVTILCDNFNQLEDGSLEVENYVVVNGAQSLSSLLQARSSISPDLKILVKIVALGGETALGEKITQNSNNQNSINARDLRSNDQIQQRLKKEISDLNYKNFSYEVKRGEDNKGKTPIPNEDAGLSILAIDLKEPWSCHQKYKVMDHSHSKIFSGVNGGKIVLFFEIMRMISDHADEFENKILGHYSLTKYFLAYTISEIIKDSPKGKMILSNPGDLIKRNKVDDFISILSDLTVQTIYNFEGEINLSEQDQDMEFDYKRDFKSPNWCRKMSTVLKTDFKKDMRKKKAAKIDDLLSKIET